MIQEIEYTITAPVKTKIDFMEFAKKMYPELNKNKAMLIAFDDLYRCEQNVRVIMEQSKPFMKIFNRVYKSYKKLKDKV